MVKLSEQKELIKTPPAPRRYVKFVFDGYVPCELAHQCHMVAKRTVINEVSKTINPIEYFEGEYEHIDKFQTFKVEPFWNSEFHGIKCLENEDEFGFFKSNADIRPGHATWIKKERAEQIFSLFSEVNQNRTINKS